MAIEKDRFFIEISVVLLINNQLYEDIVTVLCLFKEVLC